jgi:hypothetical protein
MEPHSIGTLDPDPNPDPHRDFGLDLNLELHETDANPKHCFFRQQTEKSKPVCTVSKRKLEKNPLC